MKKSLIIIIALLALLVLGGAFYWYEYRPSQIRKECTQRVYNKKPFIGSSFVQLPQVRTYNQCLHEKGLAF